MNPTTNQTPFTPLLNFTQENFYLFVRRSMVMLHVGAEQAKNEPISDAR